ncbi:WecB/TagA/CpsF family glycosyltransferase [Akkermansia sp. BIOML-A31]|uniref:WecB/TagA/CpsF family glycosyltransferase n=2 Tax=unclassified Akkermansia TaxID=2608915 RepID=UPI00122EE72B|nr:MULTISPECIES: WecB/TagA/CpsF family glycosyltransferase [unclassified Akkermansia]KAA3218989.1 WecB/TagA/CpsF family glycosyltransferase [Akkermansia sp. BIOML-A38]KAA3241173.1 WecB/TagA/CpsF family glycosyltransferase [Akkermansia sp. BIOML-A31]KAB1288021.1 WecB/TagA/CpsF family glycosyltransferase [Akkermansia sp. BIOML-A66]KAA3171525.1 WecB/TagA/CpsF family glycosyltransferase [Akkermansia sp. BIOML-A57]KAA3202463.1 WecB/TagA/CpsF family glycosyltransferase [Akkermansia sp. BIOML-A49]
MISSFPADMTSFPDKNRNDASPDIGTRDVFGFSVAVSSVGEMCSVLVERALAGEAPFLVAAADVHVITRGVHEPEYGAVLERMDVICPDGMPVVWKLNRVRGGGKTAERVSGPDLMEAVVKANAEYPGLRHFLLGGHERTLETLAARLAEKFPGFCLAGVYSPPFRYWSEKDLQDMREAIASSGANVVWVGLGCPKQERWMAEQKDLLPPAVYAGVGAAFAFHAGTVKRAPVWMQKNSLEWLYRICREPGRLLKRYVKHNSLFVWYLLTGR